MKCFAFSHVAGPALLHDLTTGADQDRTTFAVRLAQMAEVDARRLWAPDGYESMYDFCARALRLSEDEAKKRIRAARKAREFPAIFPALADGRLNLTAVLMLAAYLTPENAEELLTAAAYKSNDAIKLLLAHRFPRPDVPTRLEAIAPSSGEGAVRPLEASAQELPGLEQTPERAAAPAPWPKVTPLSPQKFDLQFTMDQEMYDDLCHLQELLSHQVPSGNVREVTRRSYKAFIAILEKRKFAATDKPRKARPRGTSNGRHVPAEVRRAVTQRDGRRCTFVTESGRRCTARTFLEFDHIQEFARGGQSTVENIRLRCRAHNQYTAECTFGTELMLKKRLEARQAAEERKRAAIEEQTKLVISGLRNLGLSARDARDVTERSGPMPGATLEVRMRAALAYLRPRGTYVGRPAPA